MVLVDQEASRPIKFMEVGPGHDPRVAQEAHDGQGPAVLTEGVSDLYLVPQEGPTQDHLSGHDRVQDHQKGHGLDHLKDQGHLKGQGHL